MHQDTIWYSEHLRNIYVAGAKQARLGLQPAAHCIRILRKALQGLGRLRIRLNVAPHLSTEAPMLAANNLASDKHAK